MADPFPIYYSPRDVAERLGFSPKSVRNWIAAGEFSGPMPVLRIHGDIRIPWQNLQRWLELHSVTGFAIRAVGLRSVEEKVLVPGIAARSQGELARKLKLRGEAASNQSHTLVSAGSTPAPATI